MSTNPKISILMPTYNDSKYISDAIESVLAQRYGNWELLIIDDGSTDNTPEIIESFRDSRIIKLRQENAGQLNALLNGAKFAKGEYFTLLHSDDELLDEEVLRRNLRSFEGESHDGIFSDLIATKQDEERRKISVVDKIDAISPVMLFLRGGSNLVPDIFFVRKDAFKNVLDNYITWNMPYWLNFNDSQISTLTLKKEEPWYKYRIYGENYLYSDIGRFEVTNGCLRTVIEVAKRLDVPFLKLQQRLVGLLGTKMKPISKFHQSSPKGLQSIMRYVINRYYEEIPKNLYFEGLINFLENIPSKRTISLSLSEDTPIFFGKDARIFFDLMNEKRLSSAYKFLLEEACRGFGEVVVEEGESRQKAEIILKMLNLPAKVKIK